LKYKPFNSCQINKYNTGKEHITAHSDNQPDFGIDPLIMVWSVGSYRKMVFRRLAYCPNKMNSTKLNNDCDPIVIDLHPNTVTVMAGTTQRYFLHEIPPIDTDKIRYSVTFRSHTGANTIEYNNFMMRKNNSQK
jgi:alkylated DNA repair dioxygenase AlkB